MTCLKTLKLCLISVVMIGLPVIVKAGKPAPDFPITLPTGVSSEMWSYFVPRDNPMTAAKVELGRKLFFDKQLSADGSLSCATCHDPSLAFADGKKVAEGIGGRRGARNSPTLLNAMFNTGQFWDGRAETLEAQAIMPLVNPDEMGNTSYAQIVARLEKENEYAGQFKEVFGGPVTIQNVAKAIAAFERTLVSAGSPFDRFVAGDRGAMSEAAIRGFVLFRSRGRCSVCHGFNQAYPFFTDQNYRNTGVAAGSRAFEPLTKRAIGLTRNGGEQAGFDRLAAEEGAAELGRFLITKNALDLGAFRTPSLRNVELTGPYFHDGSAATLLDVVKFYVRGGNESPIRDWELQAVSLTDNEQQDLIEFLKALTGDDARRMIQAGK
jgi:cytochrome c peroxidase